MMMTNHSLDSWVADVRATYVAAADLVEPPEWVRANARQLFGARRTEPARPSVALPQRVRAVLVFDSRRPGLAAAGVRSSGVADGPWQLLFRGGGVDVDLLVRPNQDGRTFNVRGQALSLVSDDLCHDVEAHPSSGSGRQRRSSTPAASSGVEPSGEFALPNLERGRYDVVFSFGTQKIELIDVEF